MPDPDFDICGLRPGIPGRFQEMLVNQISETLHLWQVPRCNVAAFDMELWVSRSLKIVALPTSDGCPGYCTITFDFLMTSDDRS